MGAAKDMWIDQIEQISEDFAFDRIDRDTAVARLQRMGINTNEAETMLDEAVA